MLDGRVLELWPDGVIMKPMRYSEEEWAAVMQVNRTWPYPAECTGHTSMVMSVLNNLQLISEALQALVECASLGALRRRDVNTVFCSARAVYNEMMAHHEVTNALIEFISSATGKKPVNLVVLRNMVRKEQERLGTALETLTGPTVHTRELLEVLKASKGCIDMCTKSAHVEIEELVFQLRKVSTPDRYQNIVQRALDRLTSVGSGINAVNSMMFAVMYGSLGPNQRIERMAIQNDGFRWTAWLTWAFLAPKYHFHYLAPLRRLIKKSRNVETLGKIGIVSHPSFPAKR